MKCLERAGVAMALVVFSSGIAAGQPLSASSAADTAAVALAKRLLEAQHAQQAFLDLMDSVLVQQRKNGSRIPPIFYDSVMARARLEAPQVIDSMAVLWAGRLSVADLQNLVGFYESPLGQRYANAQLSVTPKATAFGQRWGVRLAFDVMKSLVDKGIISPSDLSGGR